MKYPNYSLSMIPIFAICMVFSMPACEKQSYDPHSSGLSADDDPDVEEEDDESTSSDDLTDESEDTSKSPSKDDDESESEDGDTLTGDESGDSGDGDSGDSDCDQLNSSGVNKGDVMPDFMFSDQDGNMFNLHSLCDKAVHIVAAHET